MLSGTGILRHEVTSFVARILFTVIVCCLTVYGQRGSGCGHTALGPESGTIASLNYPGTYPMDVWCEWKLRVPPGRTLHLHFGDLDIEGSLNCSRGSLVITASNGSPSLGPFCGKLEAQRNLSVNSSEVTIAFKSGQHRSGRGFLLSYATDQNPVPLPTSATLVWVGDVADYPRLFHSVFCPAGCKGVAGDIWGNAEKGYRDTSVLCKAGVHAGVVSDSRGGPLTVTLGRSLTLYEATFSNGVLSKMGSLSESNLLLRQECNENLSISALNASSFWEKPDSRRQRIYWSPNNMDSGAQYLPWAADIDDHKPWLELVLTDKSNVTGIITTGSPEAFVESYNLNYSKDKKTWKVYKGGLGREGTVFDAHSDGHTRVLNSLIPAVVARAIRLQPLSWHNRAVTHVQVLGCPVKVAPRSRPSSSGESPSINVNTSTPRSSPVPTEEPVLTKNTSSSQAVIIALGVILGGVMCLSCLLAGVWWNRRRKGAHMKTNSLPKMECQGLREKSVPCLQKALISYPRKRSVHDALPSLPLSDYAEPGVVAGEHKTGSTFRPALDEGYTTPFTFGHHGNLPEYAEPLPPEPEYATPFGEPPPEAVLERAPLGHSSSGTRGFPHDDAGYDCPSHKVLLNGYCTPALCHGNGSRHASTIYAEPEACDQLPLHTYGPPAP